MIEDDDEDSVGSLESQDLLSRPSIVALTETDRLDEADITKKEASSYGATVEPNPQNSFPSKSEEKNSDQVEQVSPECTNEEGKELPVTPTNIPPTEAAPEKSKKKTEEHNLAKFMKDKAAGTSRRFHCFNDAIIITVMVIAFIVLPISSVLIGSINVGKCPKEPRLPIWLIVHGCLLSIVLIGFLQQIYVRKKLKTRMKDNKNDAINLLEAAEDENDISGEALFFFIIILLFITFWLIIGNICVFTILKKVLTSEATGCDNLLFWFSLAVIIVNFFLVVLPFCCICFDVVFLEPTFIQLHGRNSATRVTRRKTVISTR